MQWKWCVTCCLLYFILNQYMCTCRSEEESCCAEARRCQVHSYRYSTEGEYFDSVCYIYESKTFARTEFWPNETLCLYVLGPVLRVIPRMGRKGAGWTRKNVYGADLGKHKICIPFWNGDQILSLESLCLQHHWLICIKKSLNVMYLCVCL